MFKVKRLKNVTNHKGKVPLPCNFARVKLELGYLGHFSLGKRPGDCLLQGASVQVISWFLLLITVKVTTTLGAKHCAQSFTYVFFTCNNHPKGTVIFSKTAKSEGSEVTKK